MPIGVRFGGKLFLFVIPTKDTFSREVEYTLDQASIDVLGRAVGNGILSGREITATRWALACNEMEVQHNGVGLSLLESEGQTWGGGWRGGNHITYS